MTGNKKMTYGPTLPFSQELHAAKYRAINESFEQCATRQADALKDGEDHFRAYRDILLDQRFLPGGRVQNAMGSPRIVTPYNCFVSGIIRDSMTSIMKVLGQAGDTMRLGGGVGYDFSRIRYRGAAISTLGSQATGPVEWMELFNAMGGVLRSVGERKGAQMAVLRVDHPDIEEFVQCKQNEHRFRNFNISVGVTDEFMSAVQADANFDLRFAGRRIRTIKATALWDMIMRSTWDWAEPGVIFLDTINRMNNLWYCERIEATNPCGEQPLPAHAACLLGSVNLVKYVRKTAYDKELYLDLNSMEDDLYHIVRAMDNVVDRAVYPMKEQEESAKSKRRMGIGVTGLANAIEALGHPYGSPGFLMEANRVLGTLKIKTYAASIELAKEKGSFPALKRDDYLSGGFIQTLPKAIQDGIESHGIRNSHLTSIAPTGTISLSADNVSGGIEPVIFLEQKRVSRMPDGEREVTLQDYGLRVFGTTGKTSVECSTEDHLNVLFTAQRHVDSAVAKTCNIDDRCNWDAFKGIYMAAWEGGAKGLTTYNPTGKRGAVVRDVRSNLPVEGAACKIAADGTRSCD